MTTLGKIMVFFNLLFSVVTFGLIIGVYSTRTNWQVAYKKADDNMKVAQANAQTYMAEADEFRRRSEIEKKKVDEQLTLVLREKTGLEKQNKDWATKYQALDAQDRSTRVSVSSTTEELARRKDEIDKLKGFVQERDERLNKLQREKDDFRDRAIAAELQAKSERDRNSNLLTEVEKLHQEVTKIHAPGAAAGKPSSRDRYPPPADVEGLVLKADPQTGYVELSIGSDAGLKVGNTLEAFRLEPKPEYLGTIQVLDVRSDRAVAKPVSAKRGQILAGDRVSSNIVLGRK